MSDQKKIETPEWITHFKKLVEAETLYGNKVEIPARARIGWERTKEEFRTLQAEGVNLTEYLDSHPRGHHITDLQRLIIEDYHREK